MLQRTLSDDDPASGKWELPGGHLDPNDLTPLSAAVREFKEETGIDPPNTNPVGSWDSNNGVYRGFVIAVDHETDVPINLDPSQRVAMNPDDPDHDCPEIAAWFDPDDIPTNPAVRSEVRSQTDWSQLSIPQAEKSDVEPIDYEKAGEIVARRIRGDIDRLREAYGLLNEVDGLVKGKNAPAPPVINVHVPEQQAPVIHVASPEVHVAPPEVHVHQTHNHEHHIDAPITLTPTFEVHAPPVTVEHTSNHEHHVTVNPEVHMDAPIIKIPKPQVTVNMPEAPQRGRSTVTRNPDGTVSIEHE
jgi:8-oxo-dGTP pyrophosphatase MutT (NUDIX family)